MQSKKPIIAIDYDDTYSRFSLAFDAMVDIFKKCYNAKVYIVTARNKNDPITDHDLSVFDKVVYTNHKAKASVVCADVWIDDNPITLCCDMGFNLGIAGATPASNLHQSFQNESYNWHWNDVGYFYPEKKEK